MWISKQYAIFQVKKILKKFIDDKNRDSHFVKV